MKVALSLLATTIIAILGEHGVLGTPTPRSNTNVTIFAAPEGFKPPTHIASHSVDPSPESDTPLAAPSVEASASATVNAKVNSGVVAATTQYWVCVALSRSTLQYGWSQGGSMSSALSRAKGKCGKGDCSYYQCIDRGCVGLDYGSRSAQLSYARGYGSQDGNKAGSLALAACRRHDTGCRKPGHFCAKYVY